jgi:hypothetical protein
MPFVRFNVGIYSAVEQDLRKVNNPFILVLDDIDIWSWYEDQTEL